LTVKDKGYEGNESRQKKTEPQEEVLSQPSRGEWENQKGDERKKNRRRRTLRKKEKKTDLRFPLEYALSLFDW